MSKDFKAVIKNVRDGYLAQQAFYAGLKLDELPADIRKGIEDLKADLNERLKALDPLDQVPAASEAASAINWLTDSLIRMQEYANRVFANLQTMTTNLTSVQKSYNELDAKVKAGDLVEKGKVTERCDLAKAEGRKECAPEIADLRRKVITGLPAAPANIIELPAAEFAAAIEDARANLATGQAKGLALDGTGAKFLTRAIWSKQAAFTAEMAELEADGLMTKPRPGDPLRGGAGEPEPAAGEKRRRMIG